MAKKAMDIVKNIFNKPSAEELKLFNNTFKDGDSFTYAYMQDLGNNGYDLFVQNGTLLNPEDYLENEEERNRVVGIMDALFLLTKDKKRPTIVEIKNRYICVNFHNERDNGGRRAQFGISWKKGASKNEILRSAKLLGITNELDSIIEELFKK
jgi:hypothetical protein